MIFEANCAVRIAARKLIIQDLTPLLLRMLSRGTGPGADIGNPTRMTGRSDEYRRDRRSSFGAALARSERVRNAIGYRAGL